MRFIRRLLLKASLRRIIDNLSIHSFAYPQTENGLAEAGFSKTEIKKAIESKYVEEYDYPVASFGDGQNISYVALKLNKDGKKLVVAKKKAELAHFWGWLAGVLSTVIGGLILAYVFGVGR